MIDAITILGFMAGTLTTISYIPQALKIWRAHSSREVSLARYVLVCTGLSLWVGYGLFVKSLPIILTNVFSLTIAFGILLLKMRFG